MHFIVKLPICICLCHTTISVSCSLEVTCWEDSLVYDISLCFYHFPIRCIRSGVGLDVIFAFFLPFLNIGLSKLKVQILNAESCCISSGSMQCLQSTRQRFSSEKMVHVFIFMYTISMISKRNLA